MRRKNTRSSGKQTPEKGKQSDSSSKKSRRTSKRRRKSTSESENSEEDDVRQTTENETPQSETNARHNSSDTENNDSIVEKECGISEESTEKHEKKIKLKRSKPSGANDEPETYSEDKQSTRRSRRRGSPKAEEKVHQEDDDEDKKGKGKSKGKTKSKIENSQPPNESETHNASEISTNAQVTPQSPQIVNTNPVDNVVDVAVNAEDNKIENEQKEEADRDEDTKVITKNHEEYINSTNPLEKLSESVNNKNNSMEKTIELSENKTRQTLSEGNDSKNIQDANKEGTSTIAVAVTGIVNNESIEKVPNNGDIENTQAKIAEETIKSDEDFTGFPKDQSIPISEPSFVEEPMDISMDATFTLKTDDSSITVTEAEETADESQIINYKLKSQENRISKSQEPTAEKLPVCKKIILLRDLSSRPKVSRKKGWGSSTTIMDLFTPINIDTTIIQNIYTNVQLLDESEVKLDIDIKDRRKSVTDVKERKRLDRSVSSTESEYRKYETQNEETEQEDNTNIIAMNRKISIVDDSASKLKPPPSPAKNPLSNVLFITNLVRPFTLKQLRELLERTGKIKDNGFWTDKIKSKCYVQYEKIDDAEATRNALHGVHWPIGNGKKLIIDYSTEDDLENAKNPPVTPPIPETVKIEKENQEPIKKLKEEKEEKNREKLEEKRRHEHVREWDVGKVEIHRGRSRSRDRDRDRERTDKRRQSRHSPSPFEEYLTKKQKRAEDHVPQKLMDDLFQKTKTTPSIYWQPLSPEEIATKQQQRLERMAEHKRRLEESTRGRAEFGRGGPYRRRYD